MIPSVLAGQVRHGIEDFLRTTFPITNPFFAGCLDRLLAQPGEVFRGPYLSVKLPFTPASGQARPFPQVLPEDFRPYRHQELAWERLDSRAGRSPLWSQPGPGRARPIEKVNGVVIIWIPLSVCGTSRPHSGKRP